MEFTVRQATYDDAISLAPRLRQSDVREIKAAYGTEPKAALIDSLDVSDEDMCWAAVLDGEAEVMFGANPLDPYSELGGIWMIGSDRIYDNPRSFLAHCWTYLAVMHMRYPYLTNFVDCRHAAANRWMLHLGFEAVQFLPEFGVERRPFIQYISGVDHV